MRWTDDPTESVSSVVSDSGVIDRPPDDDDAEEPAAEEDSGDVTVIVYIPSERPDSAVTAETKVQLRYVEDGQLTLPVFTSNDQLVSSCGPGQAWVGIPVERIEEFRDLVGADIAIVDPVLSAPEEAGGPQ